jgi:predicted transposase/invertase (TIGR01784 family)
VNFAFQRGEKKGRDEGREEEKISTIQKCIYMNMPIDTIVELTGFSKEQIIHFTNK